MMQRPGTGLDIVYIQVLIGGYGNKDVVQS
jgi:hypothetical protein